MPVSKEVSGKGMYDVYPTLKIENGKITEGFESLAQQIVGEIQIIIDGYIVVFFAEFQEKLNAELGKLGKRAVWKSVDEALRSEEEINRIIEPFLGGDDPIFGTRVTLDLLDFFDVAKVQNLKPEQDADLNILIGCGCALAGRNGLLIYIDLPKNVLQFRAKF